MRKNHKRRSGFTLVEMMISLAVFSMLMLGLLYYTTMISHMIARNMTVNHSHDTNRVMIERAWNDLHVSATNFVLVSFDGANYTDVSPTYSGGSDTDFYFYSPTPYLINDNRANGVRFMVPMGAPYQITGDGNGNNTVAATSTSVQLNILAGGYIPVVGDKIQIPIVNQTFDIITPAPASTGTGLNGGTNYKINLGLITGAGSSSTTNSVQIGSAVYYVPAGTSVTTASGQTWPVPPATTVISTASLFHRVAYTVYNNQFRYHPNFTPPTQGYPATAWTATAADLNSVVVVRGNVTSPLPFGLLAPNSSGSANQAFLRISMESYDLAYSKTAFVDGTTTLQTTVPPMTQPPPIATY
jgi:prepilin-type N-terminal cleavage/methylation domain-containing protein